MIKRAGSNPTESESDGREKSRTPMSKQGLLYSTGDRSVTNALSMKVDKNRATI